MTAYVFTSEGKDGIPLHCVVCPQHGGRVISQHQNRRSAEIVAVAHNLCFHRKES